MGLDVFPISALILSLKEYYLHFKPDTQIKHVQFSIRCTTVTVMETTYIHNIGEPQEKSIALVHCRCKMFYFFHFY